MGAFAGPNIITSGLLFQIDPVDARSYPGSGTTIYDLSGNQINGTLNGGTTVASLTYNNTTNRSLYFQNTTATNTYTVTVPTTPFQFGTNSFTLCGWVYQLTPVNPGTPCIFGSAVSGNSLYQIGIDSLNSAPSLRFSASATDSNSVSAATSAYTVNFANTWVYSVGVFDRTNNLISQYINGLPVATISTSYTGNIGNGGQTGMGFLVSGSNPGLYGYIGAVSVYNFALSANQVAQNFNALRGRYAI